MLSPPEAVSPAQAGIWFDEQAGPSDAAYVDSYLFEVCGPLKAAALRAAIRHVGAAHPALRAVFVFANGRIEQREGPPVELVSVADRADLCWRSVDPAEGPLFQAKLLADGDRHLLWLGIHHIVSDGHSAAIILREIEDLYALALTGRPMPPTGDDGYANFIAASQAATGADAGDLADFADTRPLAFPDGDASAGRRATQCARSTEFTSRDLSAIAARHRLTPVILSVAVWSLVLARFTGIDRFPIALASTHRDGRRWNDTVGMLVNTVPVPMRVDSARPWSDHARSVRTAVARALKRRDVPYADLAARLRREARELPATVVMIGHEVTDQHLDLADLEVTRLPQRIGASPLGLDIVIDTTTEPAQVNVLAAASLTGPGTVRLMTDAYLAIVWDLADGADDPPCAALGRSSANPPQRPSEMHDLLAELAAERPDLFAEARELAECNLSDVDGPIGVLLPPGPDLVRTMAAVWLAGRRLVLLSPDDTPERRQWLIEGLGLSAVISEEGILWQEKADTEPAAPSWPADLVVVIDDGRRDLRLALARRSFDDLVHRCGAPTTDPNLVHGAAAWAWREALGRQPVLVGELSFPELGGAIPQANLEVWEHGHPVGPGEYGELVVTGLVLPFGYLDEDELNARLFPSDGTFRTGLSKRRG